MQHTEKEWWIEGNRIINSKDGHIAYMNPYCEKAQRIIDCVNGCAGIENPGAVGELINAAKLALGDLLWSNASNGHNFEIEALKNALSHIEGINP